MNHSPKKRTALPRLVHGGRRDFLRVGGLAALSLAIPGLGCGGDESAPGIDPIDPIDPFSVVALPDTQFYADELPQIYTSQTQWIVNNQTQENIVFVTHLGDVVDNGPSLRQWENARASMKLLEDAGVPYGVSLGNHDVQYSDKEYQYPLMVDHSCSPYQDFDCKAEHFLENFGPARYEHESWFGGSSPSGMSSYQEIFITPELTLLFLHIALDFPAAELRWAQQVVNQHPEAAIHVSTHRYLYDYRVVKGLPFPLSSLLGGRSHELVYMIDAKLYYEDSITAAKFFATFVAPNTNIFMVQCGHVDGEYRQVSENAAGLPVHELMADFQTFGHQGEGWMRLLRFDPDNKQVRVRTYSPHLKAYRENGAGLDASLKAIEIGYQLFAERYGALLDLEVLRAKIDYWSDESAGRQEYADLLYGEGTRDSDFTLDLDLSAYPQSRAL
ncbi:MAG: metallophosphoesterase [Deltaproteobacteria bacterium]|nr:metallophosphoesterase [Deltaproteobacteria bacterium]